MQHISLFKQNLKWKLMYKAQKWNLFLSSGRGLSSNSVLSHSVSLLWPLRHISLKMTGLNNWKNPSHHFPSPYLLGRSATEGHTGPQNAVERAGFTYGLRPLSSISIVTAHQRSPQLACRVLPAKKEILVPSQTM